MDANAEKTLDMLEEADFELILDPVEDKEFIDKWGLEEDRIPELDSNELDSDGQE